MVLFYIRKDTSQGTINSFMATTEHILLLFFISYFLQFSYFAKLFRGPLWTLWRAACLTPVTDGKVKQRHDGQPPTAVHELRSCCQLVELYLIIPFTS